MFIHSLSPVAFSFGSFAVKWYGLSYVMGLLGAWLGVRRFVRRDYPHLSSTHLDDLFSWMVLGMLVGGRLGYALFYEPEMFLSPWHLLEVWKGGMSFHGAVMGIALTGLYSCKRLGFSSRYIADRVALFAPFGIFLGRIANFINAEHYGRETTMPWGVIFSTVDQIQRHPSQIYEALCEGMFLWLLLAILYYFYQIHHKKGALLGVFLLGYSVARWICEYFRVPDGYFLNLTYGQFLCIPLIVAGILLLVKRVDVKNHALSS